jgi:hypothetical protein
VPAARHASLLRDGLTPSLARAEFDLVAHPGLNDRVRTLGARLRER